MRPLVWLSFMILFSPLVMAGMLARFAFVSLLVGWDAGKDIGRFIFTTNKGNE
jgi:hypothetical protein